MHRTSKIAIAAIACLLANCLDRNAQAADSPKKTRSAASDGKPPAAAELRTAIERSLPYIERGGDSWLQNRGCVSCHVVAFSIWSSHAASQRGISVDNQRVAKWIAFAHGESPDQKPATTLTKENVEQLKTDAVPDALLAKLKPIVSQRFAIESMFLAKLAVLLSPDELKQYRSAILNRVNRETAYADPDGYGELFLARGIDKNLDKDWAKKLTNSILEKQQPDGLWPAGGQLPSLKRPKSESSECSTMWLILALAADPDAKAMSEKARERALAAIEKTRPGVTNESLILHLMVAHRFVRPADPDSLLNDLRADQRDDGGWSWARDKRAAASDAFATGQSLYALRQIGVRNRDPMIMRAQKFLLGTQQDDGSWKVASQGPGTVIGWSYWGTTWAVIGLSGSMPE